MDSRKFVAVLVVSASAILITAMVAGTVERLNSGHVVHKKLITTQELIEEEVNKPANPLDSLLDQLTKQQNSEPAEDAEAQEEVAPEEPQPAESEVINI